MPNSPSKTSCRCHHLRFITTRGFPRGFPVGNGGFGSTFSAMTGTVCFRLCFFCFSFLGWGRLAGLKKYPLNVMKRCVFSKKCNQNVLPRYSTGDHFTQVFASQRCGSWPVILSSLPNPRARPCGVFHPVGCLNVSFVLERVVGGDWPFLKDPFWFHYIFSMFFFFFSDRYHYKALCYGPVPQVVLSLRGNNTATAARRFAAEMKRGCFKRVSKRMSKRDAVLQTSTLLGANISPEKKILKVGYVSSLEGINSINWLYLPNSRSMGCRRVHLNHVRWKIWSIFGSVSWLHCWPGLALRVSMRFWWTWRVTSLWGGLWRSIIA